MGRSMGRIRTSIDLSGRECWTRFDCGARSTYVIPDVAAGLSTIQLQQPTRTKLGGGTKSASEVALLVGNIEGKPFHTEALVIDEIGVDDEGKVIEILFGTLPMQQWGIRLCLQEEQLDLTHYPDGFLEFSPCV